MWPMVNTLFPGRWQILTLGRRISHCCEMADKSAHYNVMAPWCQFELGRWFKCSSQLNMRSLFTGVAVVAPRRIKDLCVYLGLEYVRKDLWEMLPPAAPSFIPWGVVTDDTGNNLWFRVISRVPSLSRYSHMESPQLTWLDLIFTQALKWQHIIKDAQWKMDQIQLGFVKANGFSARCAKAVISKVATHHIGVKLCAFRTTTWTGFHGCGPCHWSAATQTASRMRSEACRRSWSPPWNWCPTCRASWPRWRNRWVDLKFTASRVVMESWSVWQNVDDTSRLRFVCLLFVDL